MNNSKSKIPALLLSFFFLSGATSLVYEVLWTRRLALIYGQQILAVGAVLSIFMLGLGLGGLWGGRWVDKNPEKGVRAYGWLEIAIGLWALLSFPLLNLVEHLYLHASGLGMSQNWLNFVGLFASAVILLPPTIAMGATLPLMVRGAPSSQSFLGQNVSRFYGWNTLGAFTGAGLAGFVLLPTFGSMISLYLAATVNFVLGIAVLKTLGSEACSPDRAPEEAPHSTPGNYKLGLLTAFFLTGFASMTYQIGWTRALILTLGSSTYAFTLILVVVLAGIGLGSLLFNLLRDTWVKQLTAAHLGWCQLVIAFWGALAIPLLGVLPLVFYYFHSQLQSTFLSDLVIKAGLAALILLLPCLFQGFTFPIANQVYDLGSARSGQTVGMLYAANTFGCISGAFLSSFVFLQTLGCERLLKLGVAISLLSALIFFWSRSGSSGIGGKLALVKGLAVALLLFWLPNWNLGLMVSGPSIYSDNLPVNTISEVARYWSHPPSFYRDGLSSTVSVAFTNGKPSLKVNGKVDASLYQADLQTTYLAGYIPAFLHPNPKRAVVIGLGAGMTVEALTHIDSLEVIECVELEPAVLEANKFFAGFIDHALEDPRVTVRIADGRTHVRTSPQKYDLIISEPSNPWIAGVANLFTVDFFANCAEKLEEGGIMLQWFHLYGVAETDVAIVIKSFYEVFPEGTVWISAPGDIFLIGEMGKRTPDLERFRALFEASPKIQDRWFELNLPFPESLLGHFLMTRTTAVKNFYAAPLATDDWPVLEFTAPRSLNRPNQASLNHRMLSDCIEQRLPDGLEPNDELFARMGHGWINADLGRQVDELLARNPYGLFCRARRLVEQNAIHAGKKTYEGAFEESQGREKTIVAAFWAELEARMNAHETSEKLRRYILDHDPDWTLAPVAEALLGDSLMLQGRFQEAVPPLQQAMESPLGRIRAATLLGLTLETLEHSEASREVLEIAVEQNPYDLAALRALAQNQMTNENWSQAATHFSRILVITPEDPVALVNLGICRFRIGDVEGARKALGLALKAAPENPAVHQNAAVLERLLERN